MNAGVGCYVYGLTETMEEGCALAKKTLVEGKAEEVLKKWRAVSKEIAGRGYILRCGYFYLSMFRCVVTLQLYSWT